MEKIVPKALNRVVGAYQMLQFSEVGFNTMEQPSVLPKSSRLTALTGWTWVNCDALESTGVSATIEDVNTI